MHQSAHKLLCIELTRQIGFRISRDKMIKPRRIYLSKRNTLILDYKSNHLTSTETTAKHNVNIYTIYDGLHLGMITTTQPRKKYLLVAHLHLALKQRKLSL